MGQLADGLLIPYREQIKQLQEEVTRLKTQNKLQDSVISNLKETNLALHIGRKSRCAPYGTKQE